MIVTHADLRSLNYCNRGSRQWFDRYGLDWSRFIHEGLPEEAFLATGCGMAKALVERARARERGEV